MGNKVPALYRRYFDETGEQFEPEFEFNLDELVYELVNKARYVEHLDFVEFLGYELITDARKVGYYIPKTVKKQKGRGKKRVKCKPTGRRHYAKLILRFRQTYQKPHDVFEQHLYIPRKVTKYHYYINGTRLYLLNQIVDFSTFKNKGDIILKTSTMPIRLSRIEGKMITDTEYREREIIWYEVRMFGKKVCTPLLFMAAQYGFEEALKILEVDHYISVDGNIGGLDEYSFKVFDDLYVKVRSQYFDSYQYVRGTVGTIIQALEDSGYDKMPTDNQWRIALGGVFKMKNSSERIKLNKCEDVLVSYNTALDETTKKILSDKIQMKHLENTSTLIRWMMQNFTELITKSNLDYKNKRIRKSEYVAYAYGRNVLGGIHRILNTSRRAISKDRIEGAILTKPDILILSLSKSQMATHDDSVNDMDAFVPFKYTLKGPNGLGRSKNVANMYRKLHPSQIGVVDLNSTSTSDPGLSGVLCPLREFGSAVFDHDPEPDIYEQRIRSIENKLKIIHRFKEIVEPLKPFKEAEY